MGENEKWSSLGEGKYIFENGIVAHLYLDKHF